MNILMAADFCPPTSGNFIASLITLARKLRSDGQTVIFAFPEKQRWIDWITGEGFEAVIVGKDAMAPDVQFPVLSSLLKQYKIDLIHTHFGMFHHAILHNRSAIKDVKILIHDHMDFGIRYNLIAYYCKSFFLSAKYAAKNINVISVMQRKHRSYLFLRKKWYIPNGISFERYIDHSMTREACRSYLGFRSTDKVCLLLGWDMKRKGLDIALKAVQRCRESDPCVCLAVLGIGTGPDDSAKEFIRNETGIDPAEPWIKYLDSCEDMFAVHRAIDVYISASRKEAFSYGLLETISQDTPIVVSNIPGTRWTDVYTSSFFYSTEDAAGCANAIGRALELGRRQTNSSEIVKAYNIDGWCRQIMDVYKKL